MTFKMLMQKSLGRTIEATDLRIIDHMHLGEEAPTLVVFAGVHGNEPAGVLALEKVFAQLKKTKKDLNGNLIGIRGNLPGLNQGKRFLEQDLNRLWTAIAIQNTQTKKEELRSIEERELLSLYKTISKLLSRYTGPIYFIDIHTTSSKTIPFITINDALINRKFSRCFPVPVILGIEEYLEGPLLSYINELGYVSLGFESGQHEDVAAVENAESFIWLALFATTILPDSGQKDIKRSYHKLLTASESNKNFYEVIKRFGLRTEDSFVMSAGFKSFDMVKKGTLLATYNGKEVVASKNGTLFMPLYQAQGEEGFFMIRTIPYWILKVSEFLRKKNWDVILRLLPGISTSDRKELKVNTKIVRFFRKPLFHLLGYRTKPTHNAATLMSNRERTSKKSLYEDCLWMKKK